MRARVFRFVLRFCPRAFRDLFGDDLLSTARTLDDARPARPSQLPRVVLDALATVRDVRREMRREAHTIARGRDVSWTD
jgi:hypothetical protein